MDGTKLNNPTDPLRRVETSGAELFRRFGQTASGFPSEAVIDAACNIFLNALRQTYGQRHQAEARYDELVARLKGVLMEHYDPVTGRRRSALFPFTQNIDVPFLVDKDKVV
jgi:hypothetical protein